MNNLKRKQFLWIFCNGIFLHILLLVHSVESFTGCVIPPQAEPDFPRPAACPQPFCVRSPEYWKSHNLFRTIPLCQLWPAPFSPFMPVCGPGGMFYLNPCPVCTPPTNILCAVDVGFPGQCFNGLVGHYIITDQCAPIQFDGVAFGIIASCLNNSQIAITTFDDTSCIVGDFFLVANSSTCTIAVNNLGLQFHCCQDTVFHGTVLDILLADANGDIWLVLQKQLITVLMNIQCGNLVLPHPTFVDDVIAEAIVFVQNHFCDRPLFQGTDYDQMKNLSLILNGYNNGSCTEPLCLPLCADSCPYDIDHDLFVFDINPETQPICPETCSRTVTFWATHNNLAENVNFNDSWPLFDPSTKLCDTGLIFCPPCANGTEGEFNLDLGTLLSLTTVDGDAWLVLMRQIIATVLNLACIDGFAPTQAITNVLAQSLNLTGTFICGQPIYQGPEYQNFIDLANALNSFNNGTCQGCPQQCSDSCFFNITEDIVQHPCEGCVRTDNYFEQNYACTESTTTANCVSCPWPSYRSYLPCLAKHNETLSEINLLVPTELTRWCLDTTEEREGSMGATWLAVMLQTNTHKDPRVNVSKTYITAILNLLNCACVCPLENDAATLACNELKLNISIITRLIYHQPLGRCPVRAMITRKILDIARGMRRWNEGLKGVRSCDDGENECHTEPTVVDTYRLRLNLPILASP